MVIPLPSMRTGCLSHVCALTTFTKIAACLTCYVARYVLRHLAMLISTRVGGIFIRTTENIAKLIVRE